MEEEEEEGSTERMGVQVELWEKEEGFIRGGLSTVLESTGWLHLCLLLLPWTWLVDRSNYKEARVFFPWLVEDDDDVCSQVGATVAWPMF